MIGKFYTIINFTYRLVVGHKKTNSKMSWFCRGGRIRTCDLLVPNVK